MNTTLKIDGMSCGHCVRGVTEALQSVKGVTVTKVDLATGSAIVEHAPETSASELVAAVVEEGYAAREA